MVKEYVQVIKSERNNFIVLRLLKIFNQILKNEDTLEALNNEDRIIKEIIKKTEPKIKLVSAGGLLSSKLRIAVPKDGTSRFGKFMGFCNENDVNQENKDHTFENKIKFNNLSLKRTFSTKDIKENNYTNNNIINGNGSKNIIFTPIEKLSKINDEKEFNLIKIDKNNQNFNKASIRNKPKIKIGGDNDTDDINISKICRKNRNILLKCFSTKTKVRQNNVTNYDYYGEQEENKGENEVWNNLSFKNEKVYSVDKSRLIRKHALLKSRNSINKNISSITGKNILTQNLTNNTYNSFLFDEEVDNMKEIHKEKINHLSYPKKYTQFEKAIIDFKTDIKMKPDVYLKQII